MALQEALGVDIMICLDECPGYPAPEAEVRKAADLTLRWAARSLAARTRPEAALFPVVQGGMLPELRREQAQAMADLGFDGYAIGGLSVGEPKELMLAMVEATTPALPEDKPRYLMGVGTPEDLVEAVARGVDMFDCVLPTRNARNGMAFTEHRQGGDQKLPCTGLTPGRWMRPAAATPAATTPGPISGISMWPEKFWPIAF